MNLTPETILEITQLLQQYTHEVSDEPPHNYASLRDYILQLELQQEVALLWDLRGDIETFAENFKIRCEQRALSAEVLSSKDFPTSLTNELYWNLALLVFKPKTMAEMLKILLPNVCTQVKVSLPFQLGEGQNVKNIARTLEPVVATERNLAALNAAPTLSELTHYVITPDNILLNLGDIADFSLPLHSRVHALLTHRHSKLATQVYAHNTALQLLNADIDLLTNKGTTPRIALEQLICWLTLGGKRLSGLEEAKGPAYAAITRFCTYLLSLPAELQKGLRALPGSSQSLGETIDAVIQTGRCVELTAADISSVLKNNPKNPLLDSPPAMTAEDLKRLESKYHGKNKTRLDLERDCSLLNKFPEQLTAAAIKRIQPQNQEEWIDLVVNFPTTLYDLLWANIALEDEEESLEILSKLITYGFFNPEQKLALAKAIVNNRRRIDADVYKWAFDTKDNLVIRTFIFGLINDNFDVFGNEDILKKIAKNIELVRDLIANLPQAHLAKFVDKVSLYAPKYPESFKLLLALMTEPARYEFLIYNFASEEPSSFEALFMSLPKPKRIEAMVTANEKGRTLLHRNARKENCLKIMIPSLPKRQRLAAFKLKTKGGSTVLHKASYDVECLKLILESLNEQDRFSLVAEYDNEGYSVLHNNASDKDALECILTALPESQRLKVCKMVQTDNGETVLYKAATHFVCMEVLLRLLPQSQLLELVSTVDAHRKTVLHELADNPELFIFLFKSLPESQRLAALKLGINEHKAVIHKITSGKLLIAIFELLPESDRLNLCKLVNRDGQSILHRMKPTYVVDLLTLIPESKRFEAIQLRDRNNQTLLHIIAKLDTLVYLREIFKLLPESKLFDTLMLEGQNSEVLLHSNAVSLTNILYSLPEGHLFNVLHCFDQEEGITVLAKICDDETALQSVLACLPQDKRLLAVNTPIDANGRTALQMIVKCHPQSLAAILGALSDQERVPFLRTKVEDATVLNHLLKNNIRFYSIIGAFYRSFLPAYIAVHKYLTTKLTYGLLESKPLSFGEATRLLNILNNQSSLENIEKHLRTYLAEYQSPLANAIGEEINNALEAHESKELPSDTEEDLSERHVLKF